MTITLNKQSVPRRFRITIVRRILVDDATRSTTATAFAIASALTIANPATNAGASAAVIFIAMPLRVRV